MRVAIGMPTYGQYCSQTIRDLIALISAMKEKNIKPVIASVDSTYIKNGRRKVVESLMEYDRKHKIDYLLWIDSDMHFTPKHFFTMLEQMREADIKCLTAYYFGRQAYNPIHGMYNKKEQKYIFHIDYPLDKLVRIDATGFGFFLTDFQVWRDLFKHYKPHELFRTEWMGDKKQYVKGEDLVLCEKIRKLGYEIWLDTGVIVGHIGGLVDLTEWRTKGIKGIPYNPPFVCEV